ncbi:MAG: AMP-binding protein [Betaproteobacteria bacterium]
MSSDRYAEIYDAFRWDVPREFNIAQACCGRWSRDRWRFALYYEDEAGRTSTHTFWDLQQEANRLSNALAELGIGRGDKVALMLPQRPETVIAHVAVYQMGAVALPLSFLFGPDALEYRINDSESRVAIVDEASLPNMVPLRDRCPLLQHVIGVAGARESFTLDWQALLAAASRRYDPVATLATDPALLVYTSGTTGPPKGALMPHSCLIGNLPGFVYSHDEFPQTGDLFWSPADWAWTGGLMDALLPTLNFGYPVLGYRGRFDPEKALWLMQKYQVTSSFLFPTALKLMMKAVPEPRTRYDLGLRSIMSAGEAVGTAVFEWARDHLGVTINEMFGQTEMNYVVGNSHRLWPAKPGSIGRPYPGHRVGLLDEAGNEVPAGEVGEVAVHRIAPDGKPDPVFFLEYFRNPEGTRRKFTGDWSRTGDEARMDEDGYLWYQGRADDMFKAAGYRIGPSEIENCLVKHAAVANAAVVPSPDPLRGNVVKAFIVLTAGARGDQQLIDDLQQHVRKHLAPYEYPREIEFIDQLPMTTTGKVQRRVLREMERERKQGAVDAGG